MSCKVVRFDKGYMLYLDSEYLADSNGKYITGFYDLVREFPLDLKELTNEQLWALCKPIVQAYELGIEQTEKRMTKKILNVFELYRGEDS